MTKADIIKLIDAYWKFDNNQQPMSSWHDKQDLLKRLESDLDSVIKGELEKFARELFNTGKLRSGQNKKIAALKRVESYLNQKP